MNKLVKGSIAGAAGIALLLGGLGSFALWTDSTTVTAGAVSSGELRIVKPETTGAWKFTNGPTLSNTSVIVPGDTVTYTDTFTVKAKGDRLRAKLTVNAGELVSTISGATAASSFVVMGEGAVVDPVNKNVYTFGHGTYEVIVKVTVKFSAETTGLTGQNQTFTPDAVTVSLEQLPVV
jgi:alternate signal-mediated exported protein